MSERTSLITLLSNYACSVAQRDRGLYFTCSGLTMTIFLGFGSAVAALSVVSFVLLVQAGGDPSRGLLYSLLGLSLAVWSAHLAIRRYRRHGSFELDTDQGVLRRYRAGRMTDEYALSQITRVWLSIDATDGVRLTEQPSWLQILLDSGQIYRLAKGNERELAPVCDAMRELGLAPRFAC